MKKFKLISIVLCLTLIMSSISMAVMALTFNDVDSDPTVSWAKDSIYKMVNAGYIKGYEDQTFRPAKSISKIECLILMARMLGYEDKDFADTIKRAKNMYKSTVNKYNTTYLGELCYLMYCGVITEQDLVDYASSSNANTPLLRYQSAILMSKLLGADAEAQAFSVTNPTYADNDTIPRAAKPYVEYVSANGIMNGMDKTADGRPQFSPVTSLTRAQMATLLARVMDKMEMDVVAGTVDDVTSNTITIDGIKANIYPGTIVYLDEAESRLSQISEGSDAVMLVVTGKALIICAEETDETMSIYGKISGVSASSSGRTIVLADPENAKDTATYDVSENCKVTIAGSKANYEDLKKDQFVKLTIAGSKVTYIETADTSFETEGILEEVTYDDYDHVFFVVKDLKTEARETYIASSKGYTVIRDDAEEDVKALTEGDTVTLKLSYGKVTKITAVSKSESFKGLLKEIIISSEPAITVVIDGEEHRYKFRPGAKITVAGATSDIYGLRPNVTVTGKLDSNEVKTLSTSTAEIGTNGEFSGTVTSKNTSYKVINIKDKDGNIQNVYYNGSTTFLNTKGESTSVKSIEVGSSVSVTGVDKNGLFEATIIILR